MTPLGIFSARSCPCITTRLLATALGFAIVPAAGAQALQDTQAASVTPYRHSYGTDDMGVRIALGGLQIGLADRLRLTLTAWAPSNALIEFPPVEDRIGEFRVIERNPVGPMLTPDDRQEGIREYLLEPEHDGELEIRSFTVSFKDAREAPDTACVYFRRCARERRSDAGERHQLTTDPVPVIVATILPPDADFTVPKDIVAPMSLSPPPSPSKPGRRWIAGALVAALAFLAALWWRRRRSALQPSPELPPHRIALEALRALQNASLMNERRFEEFYVQLSGIVRRYLDARFKLGAPMQTTEELLTAAARSGAMDESQREQLVPILEQCDLVKFACYRPGAEDMKPVLEDAKAFVQVTMGGPSGAEARAS